MHVPVLVVLSCAVQFQLASATVQTYDVPRPLATCYGRYKKKTTLTRTPPVCIQSHCENMYMWKHLKQLNVQRGANAATISYINMLCKDTKQNIKQHRIKRKKRQANPLAARTGPKPKLRNRKEIRMMSDKEIQLFFDAVNSAKLNTSISPNKYDALAEFHTGITSVSAHGGCNFHGWHRLYLLMFENALRDEGPEFKDVTLPYWDSTLDAKMTDPVQSALFSDRLLGSCSGEAKGGIMRKGWESTTGVITRNCAIDGPLLTNAMIKNITKHWFLKEICGEDSEIDHDLEFYHNGVHRWIDGQMAILSSAVYDPVFWLHHCFVDLLWEKFRENQEKNGVDVESDYPVNPATMGDPDLHQPTAKMGFADLDVIDGLSKMFTTEWYKYAKRPTCNRGKQDCRSKYLKCVPAIDEAERGKGKYECMARTLKEVEEYEAEQNKPKPKPCKEKPTKPGKPNKTTTTPTTIPATTPTTTPATNETREKQPSKEIKPVQNTFCMNGQSDIRQWVYIPVKLILRRPPDYTNYGSYPVRRGKIQKAEGDIYAPKAYSNVYRHLRKPNVPAKYEDCIEPDIPTNTIYVKSMGLNYEGIYKEYAILDKRLALTVATAYLAVRKPMSEQDVSVAMLSAQDSCGRVCKPICLVPNTEIYRPCSGAIKVTGGKPLQFGNSFGDAVLNVWDFDKDASCPQLTPNSMIVSFYCDYSTDWFWPSVDPVDPVTTPSPPVTLTPPTLTTVTAGCSLGWGCFVNKPCDALKTCNEGEVLTCLKSCHMYASCFKKQYQLYRCQRGERFLNTPTRKGCVSARHNPCDYRTSGLDRWRNNRRRNNRNPNRRRQPRV